MDEGPFFNRIAVVGVGLIGGSLGLACKRVNACREVVGVSRPQTVSEAVRIGAIDRGVDYGDLADGIAGADAVFLCTPIARILSLIAQVIARADAGAVISDVGSTKAQIVAKAGQVGRPGVHFVGGHPMAGSEKSGVTASDPFLFQNAIYVLTPAPGVPDAVRDRFAAFVRRIGAQPVVMPPEVHDRVAAAISHLPQMIATALVGTVGRLDEADGRFLRLAAGGFRDLTRIASSPYDVWRDICATNGPVIREMIDRYVRSLLELRDRVGDDALGEDFGFANRVRGSIPKDSKGFLHALHEILVVAEDRPGVIADIAGALAGEGINLNDIEVLKVREGEGGTLRLGFDTRQAAERAVEILSKKGYSRRLR
jgi:prephenate dehydrogenase